MSAADVLLLPDLAKRLTLARDAAWEIESLASLLQLAGEDVDGLTVRGVTMRVKALAGVVMGSVDDPLDPPADLRYRLTGESEAKLRDPNNAEPVKVAPVDQRHQRQTDTKPLGDDEPLLAEPARAEIVSDAILGLFDKLYEMNEMIGPAGRGGRARTVWKAGFHALERRASVILSAVDDRLESTPDLAARLAKLPRVMTEEEREDARDWARLDPSVDAARASQGWPAEPAERRS